jgi:hypothetical protein
MQRAVQYLLSGLFATLFLVGIFSFGPSVGQAFANPCCGEVWQNASWGRAWRHVSSPYEIYGEVDDTLTDGHCVYIAVRYQGKSWPGLTVPSSQSCGPIEGYNTTDAPVPSGSSGVVSGVRMYRTGTGNYLTIYGS